MPYLLVASYAIGSFPTAYVFGRLLGRGDIRTIGDGNVGAQNAARLFGLKVGIAVFIIDAAKGTVTVALAHFFGAGVSAMLLAGTMCVIGHTWPIILGFRGGRGEATAIGVLLALIPQPLIVSGTFSLVTLKKTRSVIKASVVLLAPLSPLCWLFGVSWALLVFSIALPCFLGLIYIIKKQQQAMHVKREEDLSLT